MNDGLVLLETLAGLPLALPLLLLLVLPLLLCRVPTERTWVKISWGALTLSLLAWGFFVFIADLLLPAYHSLLFCLFFIAATAVVQWPLIRRLYSRWAVAPLAVFCAAVVVWHFGDFADPEVRAFKHFYSQIHNGMTEAEVQSALHNTYATSTASQPNFNHVQPGQSSIPSGLVFQMPYYPSGNKAFILVATQDSHVTGKQFDLND